MRSKRSGLNVHIEHGSPHQGHRRQPRHGSERKSFKGYHRIYPWDQGEPRSD